MLKKSFSHSITQLFSSRYMATLSVGFLLLTIAFMVYVIVSVNPSELQLVTHYTAFGVTHLYRDQWWYLLSFAVFGVLVAFLHLGLAAKIHDLKGRPFAVGFLWLGVAVIAMAWVMSFSVINVWSPV